MKPWSLLFLALFTQAVFALPLYADDPDDDSDDPNDLPDHLVELNPDPSFVFDMGVTNSGTPRVEVLLAFGTNGFAGDRNKYIVARFKGEGHVFSKDDQYEYWNVDFYPYEKVLSGRPTFVYNGYNSANTLLDFGAGSVSEDVRLNIKQDISAYVVGIYSKGLLSKFSERAFATVALKVLGAKIVRYENADESDSKFQGVGIAKANVDLGIAIASLGEGYVTVSLGAESGISYGSLENKSDHPPAQDFKGIQSDGKIRLALNAELSDTWALGLGGDWKYSYDQERTFQDTWNVFLKASLYLSFHD